MPPAANVTGVTLSGGPLNLLVGGEATLTATVQTEGEANKEVTWSTSDASVATVSGGKVTAVSAGTATITATSVGDTTKAATCTVSVTAPVAVTKVSLNETEATIEKNGTKVLTATVEPDNATNPAVAWSTSNETVATVAGGTVTAVGVGTAIITAERVIARPPVPSPFPEWFCLPARRLICVNPCSSPPR